MPFVVFVLSAAVFAQGTSEFMLSGLLAPVAADTGVSLGAAGLLTSLFAVGMVVGAPLMAMVAVPSRRALVGFLAVFAAAHVVGALTTDFATLLGTRVVAAVANAGFLAVALAALPALAAHVGRATAVVLSGVTLACIVGVPAGTVLGQALGWHAAFWAVAGLSVIALVPLCFTPIRAERPARTVWHEWAVLRDRALLVVIALGVLVNAATFAAFTYLGTMAGEWAPLALALFGLGSFAGVTVAGRYSDRHHRAMITLGAPVLVAVWVIFAAVAGSLPLLLVMSLVAGAGSFGVGSTLIGAVVRGATPAAPRLAGAIATTAFNVGAVVGPAVAGLVVAGQARNALWVSVSASVLAVVVVVQARRKPHASK